MARKLQKAALCGQLWFTQTLSGEDSEEGSTTIEYASGVIATIPPPMGILLRRQV